MTMGKGTYAYEGTEPYMFISYAHADRDRVLPLVRGLQDRGLRVWYDAEIKPGSYWSKVIANHLRRSACVLCLLSPGYAASSNCTDELLTAKKWKIPLMAGYLEHFSLPLELDMALVQVNQINRMDYDSEDLFLNELVRSECLHACKMEPPKETDTAAGQTREESSRPQPGENPANPNWLRDPFHQDMVFEEKNGAKETTTTVDPNAEDPAEAAFHRGTQLFKEGNAEKAVEQYQIAAELGHVRALCNLGHCYDRGKGVKADLAQSLKWYEQAAELGDLMAQYHVGFCYDQGKGTDPNPEAAAKWYEKAAGQGQPRAQCKMGFFYGTGRGVTQDLARSLEWYEKAAEQGDMEAQFNAGFCYDRGKGVEANPERAVMWYVRAASQGFARAQHNLGICYELGRGTGKNPVLAAKCYTSAATRDYHPAQYRLSLCYRNGIGVPKDWRKAEFWRKKSEET